MYQLRVDALWKCIKFLYQLFKLKVMLNGLYLSCMYGFQLGLD